MNLPESAAKFSFSHTTVLQKPEELAAEFSSSLQQGTLDLDNSYSTSRKPVLCTGNGLQVGCHKGGPVQPFVGSSLLITSQGFQKGCSEIYLIYMPRREKKVSQDI